MTRDEFNKAHVACIVLGTDDIPSTDELIEKIMLLANGLILRQTREHGILKFTNFKKH